jgi:hypothetical protein
MLVNYTAKGDTFSANPPRLWSTRRVFVMYSPLMANLDLAPEASVSLSFCRLVRMRSRIRKLMSCFCSISSMSSATACRLNEPCSEDSRGKRYAWKRLYLASSSQTTTRGNPRTVDNREVIRGARHVGPYREVGISSGNQALTRYAFIRAGPSPLCSVLSGMI